MEWAQIFWIRAQETRAKIGTGLHQTKSFSTARQTINSDEAAYTGGETGKLVTNKDLTSRVYTVLNGAHAAAARC